MKKYQIDAEEWSEESKRSFKYTVHKDCEDYYSDIKYTCIACNTDATFSAKEQKFSYEVEKNYIWQQRTLCTTCYAELQQIKELLAHYETLLPDSNPTILAKYLSLLLTLPRYGRKINKALENKVRLLLQKKS